MQFISKFKANVPFLSSKKNLKVYEMYDLLNRQNNSCEITEKTDDYIIFIAGTYIAI